MELESIDKFFSAYQKNAVSGTDGSYKVLRATGGKPAKQKVHSLIDGRRAQNCTIFVSHLPAYSHMLSLLQHMLLLPYTGHSDPEVKEEQLAQERKRADELERENFDVQSWLSKKELELGLRMQEKEDLETGLARMRVRLEESAQHSQAVQHAQTTEMRAEDLQQRLLSEQ
ncbi:uncharacterized protein LOC110181732 [Drosophila serrata]|uniref:uncharacterized protein LOC110181732 n=1 Tax=Drosophila serrata TaxID=7274 RepID=UPI000A1D1A66|nr:uncharacterized protein LOC110181732 [Drosophila serrata]